ncbi:MAG TPA: hypothetical protein VLC46_07130 [Thermoanaerobaculia bacterium]|jgi:hypothetical protein|nr:hypothetical protein [Thermoanaerobaculia bacterium]
MSVRTMIIAAALLLAPLVARANVEITVKSERTKLPAEGVQRSNDDKGPPAKQTIHLTLGKRWVQWDDGSDRGVYDFGRRVSIRVDREAHRLDEVSLFALLSGRQAELENGLRLGGVLEAAKVGANPMAATMAEHQFSLRPDTAGTSGIRKISGTGEQRYLWQEKELFAYSTELVPLSAADRDLFIRYVRYEVGGHPEILGDLQKLNGIPRWLRYSDPVLGDARRLDVVATKKTPDAPYALPSLEKATLKNPEAAAAAATVAASTPALRAAMAERILAGANKAADAGKPLEAMLGYIERKLMIDGDMPPDYQKRAEVILKDENVRALSGSFQVQSEEQARSAVATLMRLAPLAGEKSYVIGLFRANMEQRLGNRDAAISLFVAALTKNPFITGAWRDLGDTLDTGYDAVDTWRCYETARIIAPAHGMLADITRGEGILAQEHAEFF